MAVESMDTLRADSFANLPSKATDGQVGLVVTATDISSYVFNMAMYTATGKGWTPSQKSQVKKSSVTIDGKTAASTLIYTMEDVPYNFYPQQIIGIVVARSPDSREPPLT